MSLSTAPPTRDHILHEAARLFNDAGYEATSVAAVVEAAAVKKSDLYRHFAGKEALAVAAFDVAAAYSYRRLEQALQQPGPAAQLRAFVDELARLAEHPPFPGGCAVFNVLSGGPLPEALTERAHRQLERWRGLIRRTARQGVREGTLHPATEPEALASLVLSTMQGALLMSRASGHPTHIRHAAAHLRAHIEQYVRS